MHQNQKPKTPISPNKMFLQFTSYCELENEKVIPQSDSSASEDILTTEKENFAINWYKKGLLLHRQLTFDNSPLKAIFCKFIDESEGKPVKMRGNKEFVAMAVLENFTKLLIYLENGEVIHTSLPCDFNDIFHFSNSIILKRCEKDRNGALYYSLESGYSAVRPIQCLER